MNKGLLLDSNYLPDMLLLRDRYQMLYPLGSGGFSQTYLAKDRDLPGQPECVVKQLKPQANDPDVLSIARRLFEQEAQVLYQLGQHPHIPQLLAHFEQDGEFYLVQEYIPGQDLRQELAQKKEWLEADVISLVREILEILEFVHSHNVIHRDLKPSNIIRSAKNGHLVLIDFGAVKKISKELGEPSEEGTVAIGTQGYMAPEQAAGKPRFNSDLYALGMLAIQALTGITPSQLPEEPITGQVIWRKFVQFQTSQDPPFFVILDNLTHWDCQRRYQSATDALQDLKSLSYPKTKVISRWFHRSEPTLIPPSQVKSIVKEDYRNRQVLINKVRNFWIKGVLENSLHDRAVIKLGLTSRLDLLERPWGVVWGRDNQLLPPDVSVSDKFEEMGVGRSLLILGEPGAGKTTTLLQLARDLLNQAEQNPKQPIPVVFNLSAWRNEKNTFSQFLITELNNKYQVAPTIAKEWLQSSQLLLLLDGLDEINVKFQAQCVTAINQFCREYGAIELVVCSRMQDYQVLPERLNLQGAVCLQPLTWKQVQHYLDQVGPELTTLKIALQEDLTLQELVQSPLLLSIMTIAYQGITVEELPKMIRIEERRKHLFDTYIKRMFERSAIKSKYPQSYTKKWLIWLAKKLSKQSQTIFMIERMQPSLMDNFWQNLIYKVSLLACFFIGGGTLCYFILPKSMLLLTLIFGMLIFLPIVGLDRIKPVEQLKWSWVKFRNHLAVSLLVSPFLMFLFKVSYKLILIIVNEKPLSLVAMVSFDPVVRGIIFGWSIGLVYAIIRGFSGSTISRHTFPNQGILQSALNSLIFASIGVGILWTSSFLLQWYFRVWVFMGLCFGFVTGGGDACIKHFILRLILYFSGSIPWNYADFLDYSTRLIILQKVGGGYIFIHRLLLEHFAQLEGDRSLG